MFQNTLGSRVFYKILKLVFTFYSPFICLNKLRDKDDCIYTAVLFTPDLLKIKADP